MEEKEIIEKLEALKADPEGTDMNKFLEDIKDFIFFVPARAPQVTNVDIKHPQMPQWVVLANDQGQHMIPAFTSREELEKGNGVMDYNMIMETGYDRIMYMASKLNAKSTGFAINPFSGNYLFFTAPANARRVKDPFKEDIIKPGSIDIMIRGTVESHTIPDYIFRKSGFAEMLFDDPEKTLADTFAEAYKNVLKKKEITEKVGSPVKCPYTEDDFSSLKLSMSESLVLLEADMPKKFNEDGTASSLFIIHDTEKNIYAYYGLVKHGQEDLLVRMYESGGQKPHIFPAPKEGNEINAVMDDYQGENK
jgi:hypothetical protein